MKTLFLEYDVLFIGVGFNEPEMADFLRDLTDRVKKGAICKRRIALLHSEAEKGARTLDQLRRNFDQEKASDESKFLPLGVKCLRYFKKDNFCGLDEVLSKAFGEAPRPALEEISW